MHYYPGTIVGLFGLAYLIWSVFETNPMLKKNRAIQGGIYLGIGMVLFFLFR